MLSSPSGPAGCRGRHAGGEGQSFCVCEGHTGTRQPSRRPGAGAASRQTHCRGRARLPGPSALTSPSRFRVALLLLRAFFCQFIKQRHSQGGVLGGGESLSMRGRGGSPGRAMRQAQQHRAAARVGPWRPTRLPSLRGAGPPRPRAPRFSGMPCRLADADVSALKHCREDSQGASCSGSPAKG